MALGAWPAWGVRKLPGFLSWPRWLSQRRSLRLGDIMCRPQVRGGGVRGSALVLYLQTRGKVEPNFRVYRVKLAEILFGLVFVS